MPLITKLEIQKKNKDKSNLFIDDEFYCGIYNDVCIKHQLKVGLEIETSTLNEYILESEKTIAFNNTAKYINSSMKTDKQVKEYLNKKGYELVTIDYVINKLLEYNYLNDYEYAKCYINTYKHKYGEYKLTNNLIQKGVSKNIVESTLKEFDKDDNLIYNLAVKYLKNKEYIYENFVKLTKFLLSRGFDFDSINLTINKLKTDKLEQNSDNF